MKNSPRISVLALCLVPCALLLGCGALHNTQFAAATTGTNVIAGSVTTDIGEHTTVGASGSYNLDTGDYTAGFIVTLKQAPSDFARQFLRQAGGVENDGGLVWVLPSYDVRNVDDPVAFALKAAGNEPGGADIDFFVRDPRRSQTAATPTWGANQERKAILAKVRRERARLFKQGAAESTLDQYDRLIAWLLERDERYNARPHGLGR